MYNPGDAATSELARTLPDIRRNHTNPHWLEENEDDLYNLLHDHTRPQFIHDAATAMILVARHYLYSSQRHRWEKLLDKLLLRVLCTGDEEVIGRVRFEIGYFDIVANRADAAKLSFERAMERTNNSTDRVNGYINIVRAASLQPQIENSSYYDAMLYLAAESSNLYTRGLVYEAAAQYHIRREEGIAAAGFAQTAYAIWYRYWQRDLSKFGETSTDIDRHMGVCLLMMTMAARLAEQRLLSEQYLTEAVAHFKTLPDRHHYWIAFYELGVLQRAREDYKEAVDTFETVISYASDTGIQAYVALAMYSRGVCLTYLAQYGRAEIMLSGALERWQDAKDVPNIANAEHGIGFMYLKQGMKDAATTWLFRAMRTAKSIATPELRENILKRIQKNVNELADL
ncbi:MAG: tetratricopeptide repeat protein [Chloroflexota bacterium]